MNSDKAQDKGRNDRIQELHRQYNSALTRRQELQKEESRHKQRLLTDEEELNRLEEEITTYNMILKKKRKELTEQQDQAAKVEACRKVEHVRTLARLDIIREYRKQFDELFAKERQLAEQRYQHQCERERDELERKKARSSELASKNQELLEAAVAMEAECDQLDRECAVLKKRNTAILLLLRKNLCDAETRRRNLMRQHHQQQITISSEAKY